MGMFIINLQKNIRYEKIKKNTPTTHNLKKIPKHFTQHTKNNFLKEKIIFTILKDILMGKKYIHTRWEKNEHYALLLKK